jgi:hypothetical protein
MTNIRNRKPMPNNMNDKNKIEEQIKEIILKHETETYLS